MGAYCKCKVLSSHNEYISLQRMLDWEITKFFWHVNEWLENEKKHLPSTSRTCTPVSVWSVTGLAGASLWGQAVFNRVNLSHRSAGGMAGSSSNTCHNKTWHFHSAFCPSECCKEFHQALSYTPIVECPCRQSLTTLHQGDVLLGMFIGVLDSLAAAVLIDSCSVCDCWIARRGGRVLFCHCRRVYLTFSFWPERCMKAAVLTNLFERAHWLEKNGFSWFETFTLGGARCLLCMEARSW